VLSQLRSRIANVRGAVPRAYWYVWWGTLINRLGGFVIPLLTIYLTTVRGHSVGEAGAVVSIFGLGQIGASVVGGQLADRVGRRATLAVSLFGGAGAMLGLSFARDLTEITVMVGIVGFVGELYRPAVLALITDIVPPERRVEAFGLLHWVINIGFAFAAVVGGLIADVDFTILFVADAATMAIYGVIVLVAVPETRPIATTTSLDKPSASWFLDGPFLVFVGLSFLLTLLPIQSGAPLAAHMTWQGFSPATYGLVMAVNGIMIIVLQPLLATWAAKRDTTVMLVAAALLYGCFALHGIAGPGTLGACIHATAVAIWTLAEIVEGPTRSTVVAAMAPADARGRYQGAMVMSWGAAYFVGPQLGTLIWDDAGPRTLWLGCCALAIAVAIGFAATSRQRRSAITARSRIGSS
jgi:MFS family permease